MIEQPAFIPCDNQNLFGLLTVPDRGSDVLVVVAGGGGQAPTFHRNGIGTRMARRLAGSGFAVLRFDYGGIGDSTGDIRQFDLEKPLSDDLNSALRWGRAAGFSKFCLVGICFGGRTALSVIDGPEVISAIVLITMPLSDVLTTVLSKRIRMVDLARGLLRPATWTIGDPARRRYYGKVIRSVWRRFRRRGPDHSRRSAHAVTRLKEAGSRMIPVLMLYGSDDHLYVHAGPSLDALRGAVPSLEIDATYQGQLHAFPTLEAQDMIIEKVNSWLARRVPADAKWQPIAAEGGG